MHHMTTERTKKIALIAHDHKKNDLIESAAANRLTLLHHEIYATGTTGRLIEEELGLVVNKLQSGPLGRPTDRRQNRRG